MPTHVLEKGNKWPTVGSGWAGTCASAACSHAGLVVLVVVVLVIAFRSSVHVIILDLLRLPSAWPRRDACKPPLPGHRGHMLGVQCHAPTSRSISPLASPSVLPAASQAGEVAAWVSEPQPRFLTCVFLTSNTRGCVLALYSSWPVAVRMACPFHRRGN